MTDSFNIVDPAFLHDPFATYDVMRERAPVYWFEPGKLWLLTRYDHVARVFMDTTRFTSRRTQALIGSQVPPEDHPRYEPLARALSGWMILMDPPEHTRSRGMVAKAFTPKAMESLRPRIEELAQGSHPEARAQLASDPSLLKPAIEEVLRYDPSLYTQMRIATAEVDLDGHRIGAGQVVLLAIAAANRDPSVFPDPHRFDVTRQDNRHLSLGAGPHFCLGAALARMEAQIAIDVLFQRAPRLELTGEGPTWKPPNLMFRQLSSLPVRA